MTGEDPAPAAGGECDTITVGLAAIRLRRGDTFTISAGPERWWKRLWRWAFRRPRPPLKQFVVTSITTSEVHIGVDLANGPDHTMLWPPQ